VPLDGEPAWGFGGLPVAAFDFLGNGLDQLVSEYPICHYMFDGRNGRFLYTVDLAPEKVLPGWAGYATPVAADFVRDGKVQILVPSPYVWGLLTPDGHALWSSPAKTDHEACGDACAIGDFAGEGMLDVARVFTAKSAGGRTYLEFLDGATGRRIGDPLVSPDLRMEGIVTADVDGDGRDELMLRTAPNTLGAVHLRDGKPEIVWQVMLPADPVRAIVADVEGDGKAGLLVSCVDGTVIALGR
jgi:hypothetical protein